MFMQLNNVKELLLYTGATIGLSYHGYIMDKHAIINEM